MSYGGVVVYHRMVVACHMELLIVFILVHAIVFLAGYSGYGYGSQWAHQAPGPDQTATVVSEELFFVFLALPHALSGNQSSSSSSEKPPPNKTAKKEKKPAKGPGKGQETAGPEKGQEAAGTAKGSGNPRGARAKSGAHRNARDERSSPTSPAEEKQEPTWAEVAAKKGPQETPKKRGK